MVVPYCPDPLVAEAVAAAQTYAFLLRPSSKLRASQAAEALTQRLLIIEDLPLEDIAGPLAAYDAAEAARFAAAAGAAPASDSELDLTTWRMISDGWLRPKEQEWMADAWASRAAHESQWAVLAAFQRAAGKSWSRDKAAEVAEKIWAQWLSWGELLLGGPTAREFLQQREVDPVLQRIVDSTLVGEAE